MSEQKKISNPSTPSGVRIRGNKLVIDFYYQNERCRETLSLEPSIKNIRYAAQLKSAIEFDIGNGNFDYAKYFPTSKKLKKLENPSEVMLCSELFAHQLELYQRRHENGKLSKSSITNYRKDIRIYLTPAFGHLKLVDLTPQEIRRWLYSFNHASKTIFNALIPLRKALKTAVDEGFIIKSPLDEVDTSDIIQDVGKPKSEDIDPFTNAEKDLIINTADGQIKNLIQFCFWSGLRTGEVIALRWHDIDFTRGVISVNKSVTLYEEKSPKTESGVRKVLLLPKAREALQAQLAYTQPYNDYVFHNPNTNNRWLDSGKIRIAWAKVLNKCGVRYRYPYQMRHTYASTLLTNGENLAWIATQMGHKNTEMVIRNYGKFIPDSSISQGYKLKGNY